MVIYIYIQRERERERERTRVKQEWYIFKNFKDKIIIEQKGSGS